MRSRLPDFPKKIFLLVKRLVGEDPMQHSPEGTVSSEKLLLDASRLVLLLGRHVRHGSLACAVKRICLAFAS